VLIAYAAFRLFTPSAVAITWDSISMTQIGSVFTVTGGTSYRLFLFGLIAPNTGAKTISLSWTGGSSDAIAMGAVSVFNADQTTGWNNNSTATGTGTPSTITLTTTVDSMAIVGHADDNGSALVIATGTEDWQERALNGNYGMARNPAVGASTSVSWTLTGSVVWGEVGVNVIPFATALTPDLMVPTAGPSWII
jgi:hypothetical protein